MKTININIVFFLFLQYIGCITNYLTLLQHTRSGNIHFTFSLIENPFQIQPIYKDSFIRAFQNIPSAIVGLHTLINCPPNYWQFAKIYDIQANKTHVLFKGHHYTKYGYDHNFIFKLGYFAADLNKITSIDMKFDFFFPVDKFSSFPVIFNRAEITLFQCFLLSIDIHIPNQTPFIVGGNCTLIDIFQLKFQFFTNGDKPNDFSGYTVTFAAIVFYKSQLMIITINSLSTKPTSPQQFLDLVDFEQQNSQFLIGLIQSQTTTGCLNISLQDNLRQIKKDSNAVQYKFNWFQLIHKKISLIKITTQPFNGISYLQFQNFPSQYTYLQEPTFSSSLLYVKQQSNIIITEMLHSPSNIQTQLNLKLNCQNGQYLVKSIFRLIIVNKVEIFVNNNSAKIYLSNTVDVDKTRLEFNNSHIFDKSVQNQGDNIIITVFFNKQLYGDIFTLICLQNSGSQQIVFIFYTITKLSLSSVSFHSSTIQLSNISYYHIVNVSQFYPTSNNIEKYWFEDYLCHFILKKSLEHELISFRYKPLSLLAFQIQLQISPLFFIDNIKHYVQAKMLLVTMSTLKQDFYKDISLFHSDNGIVTQIKQAQKQINIEINNFYQYSLGIKYLSPFFQFQIINICFVNLLSTSINLSQNSLNLTLTNLLNYTNENLSLIQYNKKPQYLRFIKVEKIKQSNTIVLINKLNNPTKNDLEIQVRFPKNQNMRYQAYINFIVSLGLVQFEPKNNPIQTQIIDTQNTTEIYKIVFIIFDCFYLILCFFSFIIRQWIVGLQLMFVIQLSFYSLLPFTYSLIFNSSKILYLKYLKYSSIFIPFYQPHNANSLQINTHFFKNVNVGLGIFIILPLIYFCYSKNVSNKIQLLKSILLESSFSCIIFNGFNIFTSLVIFIQNNGLKQQIITGIFAILISTSFIIAIFLYLEFYHLVYFSKFKYKLKINLSQPCFIQYFSKMFSQFRIIIVMLEICIISILLSIKQLFFISLLLVCIIQFIIMIITLGLFTYQTKNYQQFQYLFHRIFISFICIIFTLIDFLSQKYNNQVLSMVALVSVLVFLFLQWGTTIILIAKIIKTKFQKQPQIIIIKQLQNNQQITDDKKNQSILQLNQQQITLEQDKNHINNKFKKWFQYFKEFNRLQDLGVETQIAQKLRQSQINYNEQSYSNVISNILDPIILAFSIYDLQSQYIYNLAVEKLREKQGEKNKGYHPEDWFQKRFKLTSQ